MKLMSGTFLLLSITVLLVGCKVTIVSGQGGVISEKSTGNYCPEGEICTIEVGTPDFSEDYVAKPEPGWSFLHWKKRYGGFCGNSESNPCSLNTTLFGAYPALMAILDSDERFFLEAVFEPSEPLVEDWSRVFRVTIEDAPGNCDNGGSFTLPKEVFASNFTKYRNGFVREEPYGPPDPEDPSELSNNEPLGFISSNGQYSVDYRIELLSDLGYAATIASVQAQFNADRTAFSGLLTGSVYFFDFNVTCEYQRRVVGTRINVN